MEINVYDEIAPLTEEQWARLIAYYRARGGRHVPALIAAQQFQTSMTQIQCLPGACVNGLMLWRQGHEKE